MNKNWSLPAFVTVVVRASLIVCTLLLAGCATLSLEQKEALQETARRYAAITRELSQERALAILGQPNRKEDDTWVWEKKADEQNYESLSVTFDQAGSATKIVHVTRRFTSSFFGQASRQVEREK